MQQKRCPMARMVQNHFALRSFSSEKLLLDHLPHCADCRKLYERFLLWERLDPKAIGPKNRIAKALGLQSRVSVSRLRIPIVSFASLAVIAVLIFLSFRSPKYDNQGFAARGYSQTNASQNDLRIYRVSPGQPAVRIGHSFRADDELAFAYSNTLNKNRLMIFGLDEHNRIYWFYPKWTDASQNPSAIKIQSGGNKFHELPEAISHSFTGRKLRIFSIFLDFPITVREVEKLMEKGKHPLPITGAIEQWREIRIDHE